MNERFLEPMNLCFRAGMDHKLFDVVKDERRDVIGQGKHRAILAEGSGLYERFRGSVGSISTWKTWRGN